MFSNRAQLERIVARFSLRDQNIYFVVSLTRACSLPTPTATPSREFEEPTVRCQAPRSAALTGLRLHSHAISGRFCWENEGEISGRFSGREAEADHRSKWSLPPERTSGRGRSRATGNSACGLWSRSPAPRETSKATAGSSTTYLLPLACSRS